MWDESLGHRVSKPSSSDCAKAWCLRPSRVAYGLKALGNGRSACGLWLAGQSNSLSTF